MATREICKRCFRENPLGFHVPNDVWERAVPEPYQERTLCIICFDEFATRSGVDWTATPVEFYPVSGAHFAKWSGQSHREVADRQKSPEAMTVPKSVVREWMEAMLDVRYDRIGPLLSDERKRQLERLRAAQDALVLAFGGQVDEEGIVALSREGLQGDGG